MSTENIQPEKLVEGLCVYIMELDLFRPPISLGFPFSSTFFEFLFKQNKQIYFIRNNPDLHRKIRKDLDAFFTDISELTTKDFIVYLLSISFLILLVFGAYDLFFDICPFDNFYSLLFRVIIFLSILYLFTDWRITRHRRIVGKKYDEHLRRSIQELIDYGTEFIRKEDLKPIDFPIKLKHDDYKGLVYEMKGKNRYRGVFEK